MGVDLIGALIIMVLRITDVTIGTFRTILVVQGKKILAGGAGFFEVLIWIFAMRYVVQHLDNIFNLIGYAAGFAIGNILGIALEEKVALGYSQMNIISINHTEDIARALRKSQFGVTIFSGEGGYGNVSMLMVVTRRKNFKDVRKIIDEIDPNAFITVQHSRPYRGFIHGARK
jgi:uncharacterized protein YebE (UPF0316 family)